MQVSPTEQLWHRPTFIGFVLDTLLSQDRCIFMAYQAHGMGAVPRRARHGVCRTGMLAVVSSYGPHHGEEAPLSGQRGSGTIFFTHCNLKNQYAQPQKRHNHFRASYLAEAVRTSDRGQSSPYPGQKAATSRGMIRGDVESRSNCVPFANILNT